MKKSLKNNYFELDFDDLDGKGKGEGKKIKVCKIVESVVGFGIMFGVIVNGNFFLKKWKVEKGVNGVVMVECVMVGVFGGLN